MNARWLSIFALGAFAAAVFASLRPRGAHGESERGTAMPLRMVSADLPADMNEQALAALARDAYRREMRFLDAAEPRMLFEATRVSEEAIEARRHSMAELYELGGQLFNVTFTPDVGYGSRDLPPLARFHKGRRGGPDASRCVSCHWRGGPAGGGDAADDAYLDGDGDRQSSALARNPPALSGAGVIEILAGEISTELDRQKKAFSSSGKPGDKVELSAKGISFGTLGKRADGSLDFGEVRGVDDDLVIKPFGWKGNMRTIRDAVEDALLIHHGMESDYLVAHAPKERIGPYGGQDPDGDGVRSEITEGQVTVLSLYVGMQEIPQIVPPEDGDHLMMMAEGRNLFSSLGCAGCHVPALPLASTVFSLPGRQGGAGVSVDLARDGAEPRLVPDAQRGGFQAFVFSDLKRHDMGPKLAESRADRGVEGRLFFTRPLWGLSRSRPYLHDGRAATLEDAILLHGGEAQAARDAYAALKDSERAPVRVYLTTLTRARRLVTQ
ncbi:MAG: di-heme oxidoredictase family protein [Byssovorax sp.]